MKQALDQTHITQLSDQAKDRMIGICRKFGFAMTEDKDEIEVNGKMCWLLTLDHLKAIAQNLGWQFKSENRGVGQPPVWVITRSKGNLRVENEELLDGLWEAVKDLFEKGLPYEV